MQVSVQRLVVAHLIPRLFHGHISNVLDGEATGRFFTNGFGTGMQFDNRIFPGRLDGQRRAG